MLSAITAERCPRSRGIRTLNVLNGTILAECKPRHRHQEFLAFLRSIDKAVPAELDVHCIVDNYASHKHPKVKAWLADRPRWHMHFVPTYSSWLNQVERFFAIITDKAIRRGSFTSVKELTNKQDRQLRQPIQRELQALHLDGHSRFNPRQARSAVRTNYWDGTLGCFIFRTTGYNSIRTLTARLRYFHAVSGGLLAAMPLELRLRGKSTAQSYRAPIYYVDLAIRAGISLAETISSARETAAALAASGFEQGALDEAAKQGFAGGAFEDSGENGLEVVEEFFLEQLAISADETSPGTRLHVNLSKKLREKAERVGAVGTVVANNE